MGLLKRYGVTADVAIHAPHREGDDRNHHAHILTTTREAVAAWVEDLHEQCLVAFEATSGCDGPLIAPLAAGGLRFSRVNPRHAREFARAIGVLAKTDRVDARVLAEMGARLALPLTVPATPERERLANFTRRRRQLVEMRKAEKLRRHSTGQAEIGEEIKAMIVLLSERIDALDRRISTLIAEDTELSAQARLLRAVRGIGPSVLATLLGELPELGSLSHRRIAGRPRAPCSRERHVGRGVVRLGGRRKVRAALYIAALSASRRVSALAAMRERARRKGKAPKTILIAVARQLLVILNAMVRNQTPLRA